MTKEEIIEYFEYFNNPDPSCDGIERFLSVNGENEVFERLKNSNNLQLNKVRLNQLLLLSGLNNVTYGFFKYYWMELQNNHPYNLKNLEFGHPEHDENEDETLKCVGGYEKDNIERYFEENTIKGIEEKKEDENIIQTIEHLRWGFLRFYTDSLLYFGNINLGFTELNKKSYSELKDFFNSRAFDLNEIKERGECFKFNEIDQEDRYLISEAVCKNLDAAYSTKTALRKKLIDRFEEASSKGHKPVKVGALLDKDKRFNLTKSKDLNQDKNEKKLILSMEDDVSTADIINIEISSIKEIDSVVLALYKRFKEARNQAINNTKLYLSILNDLDVYVATSMRSKDDFITMSKNCYNIFY